MPAVTGEDLMESEPPLDIYEQVMKEDGEA